MSIQGIDYGLGKTNVGESGLRYGVIPFHDVLQAWVDSSSPVEEEDCYCPKCGENLPLELIRRYSEMYCPKCGALSEDYDFYPDPTQDKYEDDGYFCHHSRDDSDIWIEKSPFYTYAKFCSPCAPGACFLRNPLEPDASLEKCYCFGHDWFENTKAPYRVFRVDNDEEVFSDNSI